MTVSGRDSLGESVHVLADGRARPVEVVDDEQHSAVAGLGECVEQCEGPVAAGFTGVAAFGECGVPSAFSPLSVEISEGSERVALDR